MLHLTKDALAEERVSNTEPLTKDGANVKTDLDSESETKEEKPRQVSERSAALARRERGEINREYPRRRVFSLTPWPPWLRHISSLIACLLQHRNVCSRLLSLCSVSFVHGIWTESDSENVKSYCSSMTSAEDTWSTKMQEKLRTSTGREVEEETRSR